jgi:WXG100 family type VII secretion target
MSTKFSVTNNAVGQAASKLDGDAAQLEQLAQRLASTLEELMPHWKGQAAQAFHGPKEQITQGAKQCAMAARQLQSKVSAAGQSYQSGEQDQASQIRSQAAGMDPAKFNL